MSDKPRVRKEKHAWVARWEWRGPFMIMASTLDGLLEDIDRHKRIQRRLDEPVKGERFFRALDKAKSWYFIVAFIATWPISVAVNAILERL